MEVEYFYEKRAHIGICGLATNEYFFVCTANAAVSLLGCQYRLHKIEQLLKYCT